MSKKRVIRAAEIMATSADQSEEGQIAALEADGFDRGQAHRLVALLPLAFSRPVVEELGITDFSPFITALRADGSMIKAQLMRQPEYALGLALAREHRLRGAMDHDVFQRIASGSADMNAVDEAFNASEDIKGSAIASALVSTHYAPYLIE